MGPLEVFARRFKKEKTPSRRDDDDEEEEDVLSSRLANTRISSPSPVKPLPTPPPSFPPHPHQRGGHLPQSVSLQGLAPQRASYQHGSTYNHASDPRLSHQQPYAPQYRPEHQVKHHRPPPPSYSHSTTVPIEQQRPPPPPHYIPVDTFAVGRRLPNPWELAATLPSPSFDPSLLASNRLPRPVSAPVLPPIERKIKRGKAIVTDPALPPGRHQCWGIKRDGQRCTRRVGTASSSASPRKGRGKTRTPSKSPSPTKTKGNGGAYGSAIIVSDSEEDNWSEASEEEEEEEEDDDRRREYCHQHSREINKTDGFILPGVRRRRTGGGGGGGGGAKGAMMGGGDGTYVDFNIFLRFIPSREGINPTAENGCKAKLRTAMSQPPTEVDWLQKGFIYIYELRDRSSDTHIALKVGRAVNVFKRFDEWRSQCQSKSPLLRAFFPRAEEGAAGVDSAHLHQQQGVLPGASASLNVGALLSHKWERLIHIELSHHGLRLDDRCGDCGAKHREIFLLPRAFGYDGTRRVVERWLGFVRLVARDGMGA